MPKKNSNNWQTSNRNQIHCILCGEDIAFSFKWKITDCKHSGQQGNASFEL